MQEITKKIKDDALLKFAPVIEQLAAEGKSSDDIAETFRNHVDRKVREFYKKKDFIEVGTVIESLEFKNPDSKAERVFYYMLIESGLKFVFQRKIGPYTADYLINGNLIVELDGPLHTEAHDNKRDAYLRNLGYQIIRIPLWILAMDHKAVIDEIIESARTNWTRKNKR